MADIYDKEDLRKAEHDSSQKNDTANPQTDSSIKHSPDGSYDSSPSFYSGSSAGNIKYGASAQGPKEKDSLYNAASSRPGSVSYKNVLGTRRRKILAGGGVAGTVLAGGIFLFTIVSGPLQFVHIAQLMQHFHFASQQDAGDDRMGKLYRYIRNGNNAGETRLGYLGSTMKKNMIADLGKIGLTPDFSATTTTNAYRGFTIDTQNPDSPYYGKSEEEIKQILIDKGIEPNAITTSEKKVKVTFEGYRRKKQSLKFLVDEAGKSKIPSAVRVRVLKRYGLVTWHPLKRLNTKGQVKISDLYNSWKQERKTRLKTGIDPPVNEDISKANKGTDAKGDPIPLDPEDQQAAINTPKDPETSKGVLNGLNGNKGIGIAGGAAAVLGLVCSVKAVNDNATQIRYNQVFMPMIRMGMDAVVVGNQIMSNQDVDTTQLSFLAKSFNKVDDKGNQVSTWSQAASIKAEEGESGGIDIDQGTKDILANKPISWLAWTNNLGAICSPAVQFVAGGISIALGVVSGGVIPAATGAVTGAVLTPKIIEWASNLVAGNAVDVLAAGADWGNYVNIGSKLGGNSMSLLFGGVALSGGQSGQLRQIQNQKYQAEFNSQSLAHKLFSPSDSRSAMAKMIDNTSPSFNQNINKVAAMFLHPFKYLGNLSGLLFHKADAASKYDYGFPEIGYSQADLNNADVQDPYANADAVATILDNDTDGNYVKKAKNCFGIDLKKVDNDVRGQARWDAIPTEDSKPIDPYSSDYQQYNCTDTTDPKWLKIRFFIFDTGIMEGYACYKGDDTSCANNGFEDSGDSAPGPTAASSGTASGFYQNPLRDVKNLVPERVDQGVDYGGSGPVYALGNGKLVNITNSGWAISGGPPTFMAYQLADGPAAGKFVFVAENCIPNPNLKIGSAVDSNTVLCTMVNASPHIETGWADGQALGAAKASDVWGSNVDDDQHYTAYGSNFSQLLDSLGAPPGTIQPGAIKLGKLEPGWPSW